MKNKNFIRFYNNENIIILLVHFLAVFILFICLITIFAHGPIINSDTLSYFNLANKVADGYFPYSSFYSPGYPLIVGIISKYLNLSYVYISNFFAFSVFFLSIYLWFYILKVQFGKIYNSIFCLSLSIIFTNLWWSIKIINFAHADSIFYVLVLLICFQLLLWIKKSTLSRFIFISFLAAISVWIKYNGLIFLPLLLILLVFQKGLNRKVVYALFPVVFILGSFILFKFVNNGEVIKHLETNRSFFGWQGKASVDTILTNIKDGGNVFIQYFISNLYRKFSIDFLNYFVALILFLIPVIFFNKKNQNFIGFVFYLFFLLYIIGYMTISYFTNHTEIDQRTMFPAYIFLTICVLSIFYKTSFFVKYCLVFFLLLNVLRSFLGFSDWIHRAPMDSFNNIDKFQNKKSLNFLRDIICQKNIPLNLVYTNNSRYLTATFNYEFVSNIPSKTQFIRGKFREKSSDQLNDEIDELIKNLVLLNAIVVLFDYEEEEKIFASLTGLKKVYIENDLIIYNE